jgi:hypothetical protein
MIKKIIKTQYHSRCSENSVLAGNTGKNVIVNQEKNLLF